MQHLEHNGARPLIKACTVPPETLWGNLMVEAIVRRTVISGNCIRNYYCIEVQYARAAQALPRKRPHVDKGTWTSCQIQHRPSSSTPL
jgi:hypothetical protein